MAYTVKYLRFKKVIMFVIVFFISNNEKEIERVVLHGLFSHKDKIEVKI